MSPVFFFERLPRIYLVVLAAAWLLGAADVIALVDESGGGKGGALGATVLVNVSDQPPAKVPMSPP